MSYRLINANEIAIKDPEVNDMPCVFADLPNGLHDQFIEERKKGHWILSDDRQWKTCSECGAEIDISMGTGVYVGVDAVSEMRFCPNCGARMDGESDG